MKVKWFKELWPSEEAVTLVEEKKREHAKANCLAEKRAKQKRARRIMLLLWPMWIISTIFIGFAAWALSVYFEATVQLQVLTIILLPVALNITTIVAGWSPVEQKTEWVILLFGKWFDTWEPGLHIKLPFFFVKAKVPMYTQALTLYMDGSIRNGVKEAQINFKDTTSAVTAQIFFRIFSSHRAVFEIDDIFKGVREKMDSGLRAYYGPKTLDEAIAEKDEAIVEKNEVTAEKDEDIEKKRETKLDKVIEQKATESDVFKCWGLEIDSIAITDIAIPESIREQRDKVLAAEKEKEAALIKIDTAKHEAEAQRIRKEQEGRGAGQEIKMLMDGSGITEPKIAALYLLNKRYYEAIQGNKGVVISGQTTGAPIMGAELAAAFGLTAELTKDTDVKKDVKKEGK